MLLSRALRGLLACSLLASSLLACAEPSPPTSQPQPDAGPQTPDAGPQAPDAGPQTPDAGPWVNSGCDRSANVVDTSVSTNVAIDIRQFQARTYHLEQEISVRPTAAGSSISLFGVAFEMGESSHGYRYNGQQVTFCTEPFVAGDLVTVTVRFTVSEERQGFPPGSLAGLRVWEDTRGSVVGPYSTPFLAATWILSPNTMSWIDPAHAGNPAFDSVRLSVTAPEGFHVVGPGAATTIGETWNFEVNHPMPVYTLSFAASPDYVALPPVTTTSGVRLAGAVFPDRRAVATGHLRAAGQALDWMSARIGPFAFGTEMGFAEIPSYPGAFEHTNAVWLGSSTLSGASGGDIVAMHEVVHHWWGNNVQIADWQHLWLSEAFTDWTTIFAIYEEQDPTAARSLQAQIRRAAAQMSQASPSVGPLRFANSGDVVTQIGNNLLFFYRYGAAFLEMVDLRLRRDHATDLVAVLRLWFARAGGRSATTEEFRDFLGEQTGTPQVWNALFADWVTQVPAPTLELSDYSFANGIVSLTVRRVGGAGQDLSELPITFSGADGEHTVTAALAAGQDTALATMNLATEPSTIRVDRDGLYILRVVGASGWSGPAIAPAP